MSGLGGWPSISEPAPVERPAALAVGQRTGVTNPVTEPSPVNVSGPSCGSSKDSVIVNVHEVVVARSCLPELPCSSPDCPASGVGWWRCRVRFGLAWGESRAEGSRGVDTRSTNSFDRTR